MVDKKLKEALELLGGKAILKDQEDYYILLTLKEFRKMKQEGIEGLTKQELVDKINTDIAMWRMNQEKEGDALDSVNWEEFEKNEGAQEIQYEKA
jgi:hypothetical protein